MYNNINYITYNNFTINWYLQVSVNSKMFVNSQLFIALQAAIARSI